MAKVRSLLNLGAVMSDARRYILLPAEGFVNDRLRVLTNVTRKRQGHTRLGVEARKNLPNVVGVEDIEIVDSIADDAPRIIVAPPETARTLRKTGGAFVVASIRKYRLAIRPFVKVRVKGFFTGASERTSFKVCVQDARSGAALPGVLVVVVLDTISMKGISRRTGRSGQVTLTLPGRSCAHCAATRLSPTRLLGPFWAKHNAEGWVLRRLGPDRPVNSGLSPAGLSEAFEEPGAGFVSES